MENKPSFIHELPPWAKGVLAVAGILAVAASAYGIYRWNKNRIADAGAKAETGNIDKEAADLQRKGIKLTRPQSQIDSIANSFFVAMNGIGSDSTAIYAAASQIRNQADLLAVKKAYGIRELSSGSFNPVPNFRGTLSQALAEELDSSERNALNLMLAKKGVGNIV